MTELSTKLGVISEVIVLIFNILIFMQLMELKKDNKPNRIIMYAGSAFILAVFFVCAFTGIMPEALASFVCVTVPTFIFFMILSKYKDLRFFVTFCFLDTITLIITFFSRATTIKGSEITGIVSPIIVCIAMLIIYIKGKPYFKRYREIITNVDDGWGAMALSTALIYILLIFSSAYPIPLIERPEYLNVYAFLSVTILSFYAVFILNILQKKKLSDLNTQLVKEQQWHRIAYMDALTGMKNRMSYMEHVNELERTPSTEAPIHAVMLDIDNFKKINDTLGHHIGDSTLQNAARLINDVFSDKRYSKFRIGGDEFAIIAYDVDHEELKNKIEEIKSREFGSSVGCSFSVGYSSVDKNQLNAVETAFIRADKEMYEDKKLASKFVPGGAV